MTKKTSVFLGGFRYQLDGCPLFRSSHNFYPLALLFLFQDYFHISPAIFSLSSNATILYAIRNIYDSLFG